MARRHRGTITSLGYNIIGKTTNNLGETIAVITPTTGDQFDTGAAPVDLQPLANNGGPTPTHALGAGSIAIDQGESSGLSTDQRGEDPSVRSGRRGQRHRRRRRGRRGRRSAGRLFSNAPPDAVDDAATVEVNSGANIIDVLANDSDPDPDTLTITAVTQGSNGAVTNNGTR